jgi:hypothetical protein
VFLPNQAAHTLGVDSADQQALFLIIQGLRPVGEPTIRQHMLGAISILLWK